MSKSFKEVYKDTMMPPPPLPWYGLGEIVCYGGYRWEVTAFEPNEAEGCWMYDLRRVDGTDKVANDILEMGLMKSYKKSFEKSNEYDEKIQSYMSKLGISGAGPVPESLLARQDLEVTKSVDVENFAVWYYDQLGAQKCAVFKDYIDAEAYARVLDGIGMFKDVKIMKGQVEQTGKQLKAAAQDAEEGEMDKSDLVQNIKNIQLRRQKATLAARSEGAAKSFKQGWKEIVNRSNKN